MLGGRRCIGRDRTEACRRGRRPKAQPRTGPDKSAPSRWRFRPPSPSTLSFRLLPPGAASTYSRSVLGAGVNLRITRSPCKAVARQKACSLRERIRPHFHRCRVDLWKARDTGEGARLSTDPDTLRLDITHVIVRRL